MTPNQGGPFHIVHSEVVRQHVRMMLQRALARGADKEVVADLRAIQDQLALNPIAWGEERGNLLHLGMTVRHMVTRVFHVVFAVNPIHKFVLVLNYVPVSDYSFLEAP